ncbi:MAG: hypothetical protein SFV52_05970 [Saprospiraceae bacterium]|nr:hypothetical protein [Saprospiraceae bacterium]
MKIVNHRIRSVWVPVLSLMLSCGQAQAQPASKAIALTPAMVTQLTGGTQNADALVDGDVTTPWFPGWKAADYPARCRIDLGKSYFVDSIRVYDAFSSPDFYVFYANDLHEEPKFAHRTVLNAFQTWRPIPIKQELRYLYLTLVQPYGDRQITEVVVLEGDTTSVPVDPPDTVRVRGEADKINLCGFHWVPLDKLQPFKMLRLYISGGWLWRPDGLFVEPLYQAGPMIPGYDSYFASAKDQDLVILPAIHQTPDWYAGVSQGIGSNDYPPIKPGLSRTNPASYKDYAEFWWQFTARYGRVSHPISRLRVDSTPRWTNDPPNVPKTGLDLIKFVEVWNEPDKWWKLGGPEADIYMQPEEYAAMLSICYDSIKAADPSMVVVMSGLSGHDLPYLERMDQWFKANRADQLFAADVINTHHYSNIGNLPNRWPPSWQDNGAICPEADLAFPLIAGVVQFAKARNKQIWVTEFGSDTRPPSWMYSPPRGGFSSEELQAQWLARDYLEYIRYGVDNLFMFNAIDEEGAPSGGLYQSSGMMYGYGHPVPFSPKPSYITLTDLIEALSETQYEADKSMTSPNVRVMSFRKKDGKERLVYWSPTMTGATVNFTLPGVPMLTATEWPQIHDVN